MSKNDFINFKFLSKIYLKLKKNRLESIESEIKALKEELQRERQKIEDSKAQIEKIKLESNSFKARSEQLDKLLDGKTYTINVKNNNYILSPWENLQIKKLSAGYSIISKAQQTIYVFEDNMKYFLEYALNINYSVVVLSADRNNVQLAITFSIK